MLIRTVRALALIGKPITARNLAGSYRIGPTLAALRWLRNFGYVDSGTSRLDGLPVPVYWLTDVGKQLHQRIYASVET
ncbi:hypothetical protein [Nocardia sp. GP40]|uniref:hypothetical protein n=1 Tax=Nocardia sp. GP40 TaxID=3156268 RepID=UPI003D1B22C5